MTAQVKKTTAKAATTKTTEAPPKAPAKTTETRGRKVTELNMTAMRAVVKDLETTSSKIRALNAKGYSRSEIARFLGKKYQHVRNVLITPLVSDQKGQ